MSKYRLRLVLPPIDCIPGCGDCCGIVPAAQRELADIKRYVEKQNIKPLDQGVRCPLFQGGKCAVHPVRPRVCQAFGHERGRLECPHGRGKHLREPRSLAGWILAPGKAVSTLHDAFLGPGATMRALESLNVDPADYVAAEKLLGGL
jgi:hypothetical protein